MPVSRKPTRFYTVIIIGESISPYRPIKSLEVGDDTEEFVRQGPNHEPNRKNVSSR